MFSANQCLVELGCCSPLHQLLLFFFLFVSATVVISRQLLRPLAEQLHLHRVLRRGDQEAGPELQLDPDHPPGQDLALGVGKLQRANLEHHPPTGLQRVLPASARHLQQLELTGSDIWRLK